MNDADRRMKKRPAISRAASRRPLAHRPRRSPARGLRLFVLAFAAAFAARAAPPAVSPSNPLTLDDAIRLALQNNQRVKVSAFSPQISRAHVITAYGAFDPAITFRRTYSETETAGTLAPFARRPLAQSDDYSLSLDGLMPWGLTYSLGATATNSRGTFNSFADNYVTFGGVTVTQPLLRGFGFGATLANLRVAKANRGISDWQHKQTVIDTITSVVFAYNNLEQARENLRIAVLSRDGAAQLLKENEKKLNVGATSDAEVTQARARVANREETILFAERSVHDIENQLRLLIGDTAFSVNGAPLETVKLAAAPEIAVDPAADVKQAYELRPDYQAARLGVAIDRANNTLAQNQLLPRVDFVGSYGYSGLDRDFATARSQVRNEDARSYSAGVVVRIPLTFTEGRGRARAAKLNLRQGEADLVRLEQDIAIAVTAAAGQIETTKQRVAVARTGLELAQQALNNEQKRFKAGTSTTFFVLQQQEILSGAQNSYARALADQRRATASYDRELGATLARYQIKLD
jgi:outer membrane protein